MKLDYIYIPYICFLRDYVSIEVYNYKIILKSLKYPFKIQNKGI